jgi:hypothetical protein
MPLRERVRRALFPLVERDFTFDRYDGFLKRLVSDGCRVVALHDLRLTDAAEQPLVALRHDVDESLDSALKLARLEYGRGVRATYFVLTRLPTGPIRGYSSGCERCRTTTDTRSASTTTS